MTLRLLSPVYKISMYNLDLHNPDRTQDTENIDNQSFEYKDEDNVIQDMERKGATDVVI